MLHLILCDDDPHHNQTLTHHLEQIRPKLPMDICIDLATTDPQAVIRHAASSPSAPEKTVYMLDLELGGSTNGLELSAAIREYRPTSYVVFVSAYAEYAMDSLRSHAFDFILKPYSTNRLENALRDIILHIQRSKSVYPLAVTAGTVTQVLDQKEIRYFQMQREYVTAHMNGSTFTWRESLTKLMPRLNPQWFLRIHKSCAINRLYVQQLDLHAREVTLKGGMVLPISRQTARTLEEELKKPVSEISG